MTTKKSVLHTPTPKNVFLHLLMIAMLYATVIASITLYFQYINELFYDTALYDSHTGHYNGIRWGSSVALVAFPVYVYVSFIIAREVRKNKEVREMKIRRWLLYFTQFITALTIIVDLMILLYQFFGGELTARFGLKIAVVLIIAAVVLGYYHWEIHHSGEKSHLPKAMAISVGMVLLLSIIAGFFVAGSPMHQRSIRFDEQRIQDLTTMQDTVLSYVQSKKTVPSEQEFWKWMNTIPTDPATDEKYTYTKKSETAFAVCATFQNESEEDKSSVYMAPTGMYSEDVQLNGSIDWIHPKGYYCFERELTIQSK